MPDPTESELMRALTGSSSPPPHALNQLLSLLRPTLCREAERSIPDAVRGKLDSSDLVQESLTIAYLSFGEFRGSTPREFRGWLRSILENVLHRNVRHYGRQKRSVRREKHLPEEIPSPGRTETPSELAIATETREATQRAFALLPDDMRQVITLKRDGLSYADIADRMERTEVAVRRAHARALVRWKELMGEVGNV